MILVIHGNDTASSRNLYFEEKHKFKNFIFFEGESVNFNDLFSATQSKSLFEEKTVILIENFFAKNKSNTNIFKQIIDFINKSDNLDMVFWEGSEISKVALSQLKNAVVKSFSFPQNLFLFLDNIKPNNSNYLIKLFHELEKSSETELIFFMILRQFRLLLGCIDTNINSIDEIKRLAPWQLSKLKKQLSYFTKEDLITTYNKLFSLDLGQKTGSSSANLTQAIDFFLLDL